MRASLMLHNVLNSSGLQVGVKATVIIIIIIIIYSILFKYSDQRVRPAELHLLLITHDSCRAQQQQVTIKHGADFHLRFIIIAVCSV